MHIVRNKKSRNAMFSSANFFLVISMLACFGTNPVWSNPDKEFAGWFSQREESSSESSSSLPPPPGGSSSRKKLENCVLDNVMAVDEEGENLLLNETLIVDGCLLECGKKTLLSTVRQGSIVTVRNGGHVKNCEVFLMKEKDIEEESFNIDFNEEDETATGTGTIAPTSWGTYFTTGDSSQRATYITKTTIYKANPLAGFACDQGDCVLENSRCSALELDAEDPPSSVLVMRECVLVQLGAADVRIQGGLVEDPNVSVHGITVDAGFDPEQHTSPDDGTDYAKARLLLDGVTIRNQFNDGIVVLGGANTIRITDSIIFGNAAEGINVVGGYGLLFFAVFGGFIENNGRSGISMTQYQVQQNSTGDANGNEVPIFLPTSAEMVISDVVLKNNGRSGLIVARIDDIVIDGGIFDRNGLSGISILRASTIRLQGVISKNNFLNGLSVEAEQATVEIANSVFLSNGKGSKQIWKKAGVYMWLPKRVTITNTVSSKNKKDGIILYDVPKLSLTDVDATRNGLNGIHIRESDAAYGYDYTANSDYLVGAYYYPWHGDDDFHSGGGYLRKELKPPQSPTLGEYVDSDPAVISQHLEWFRKSNIGLLVTSWWGPDRIEDTTTRNILLEHRFIGNLKIALHYETTSRIKEEAGQDMSVPKSDIEHMCEYYFDHPNYYKIDGRPVLVIYISRKLEQLGTLESAVSTMRRAATKCGHNIYLIGDAVFDKAPEADEGESFASFRLFDAVTNYDVYGSSGASKRDTPYAGTEAVDAFYTEQEKWRKLALEQNCRFIPPVSPGYNDRAVRMEKDNKPLSRRLTESSEEGSLFKYQLEKALPLVDPEVDNLILVNSFNEWHEDTQIEPARVANTDTESLQDGTNIATEPEEFTFGLEYVGYGELYLDILRNATSSLVPEEKDLEVIYEPSIVDFTNVRTCKNKDDGIRFYVTENSLDDQAEFIFNPGPGIVSCENKGFDYEFHGGGNVAFQISSNDGIVGDKCANGELELECDFSNLLKSCKQSYCRHRDIVTTGGGVINDHKIQ